MVIFSLSSPSRFLRSIPSFPIPAARILRPFRLPVGRRVVRLAMSESTSSKRPHTNRLAAEHSPYLLQHSHNPVNWYPWGEEAFEQARRRGIPIFLSIGYSTCHWCHVMEVESFEDEEIAKMLNDWFVSIKVDREERPDVDKVYMTYVQALYGGGGWPLSVFLSPNLRPLMGGTYFPPDDKFGRPGFKTVLRKVRGAWKDNAQMLENAGNNAIEQLSDALSASANSHRLSAALSQSSVGICAKQLEERYDQKFGGFGSAPKFPRPVELHLMLYETKKLCDSGKRSESNETLEMVCHSLKCMARGGVHDHIGGGFHRYSVDECWHVPHFEKMLYDQGQLVNAYLDTFMHTRDVFYASLARDVLDYLRRNMVGAHGEIYSAEDADSADHEGSTKKKEGAFYVWTSKEVEDALGDHANLFKDHYYIKASGNCDLSRMSDPHNEFEEKNVLIERKEGISMSSKWSLSLDEYSVILGECRKELYGRRMKRPKPHLDDKVIVSWNGLTISALARASKILRNEPKETKHHFPIVGCDPSEYLQGAENAAYFIKNFLYDEHKHRLFHSYRNGPSKAPAYLDDYAFLICALLDLFEFGGKTEWLSWAMELQSSQDELFLDREGGGYFNTPGEDPSILLRAKEDYDGAEPSGNSVSAINLIRLSNMFTAGKSDYYREIAEHLLAVFETRLKDQSIAVPLMCIAADMLSVPSRKQVVLAGNKSSAEFDELVVASHGSYEPNKTVIQVDPSIPGDIEFWEENNPSIAQMAKASMSAGKMAEAHVCQDFSCRAPVDDPEALFSMLNG